MKDQEKKESRVSSRKRRTWQGLLLLPTLSTHPDQSPKIFSLSRKTRKIKGVSTSLISQPDQWLRWSKEKSKSQEALPPWKWAPSRYSLRLLKEAQIKKPKKMEKPRKREPKWPPSSSTERSSLRLMESKKLSTFDIPLRLETPDITVRDARDLDKLRCSTHLRVGLPCCLLTWRRAGTSHLRS